MTPWPSGFEIRSQRIDVEALFGFYRSLRHIAKLADGISGISTADSRSELSAPTTRLGEVRYPRKISFGRNLYLLVMPKGGRHWRYCYRYGGKRKTLALGTYPDVPMVRARSRHQAARKLLAAGVDPSLRRTRSTKRYH